MYSLRINKRRQLLKPEVLLFAWPNQYFFWRPSWMLMRTLEVNVYCPKLVIIKMLQSNIWRESRKISKETCKAVTWELTRKSDRRDATLRSNDINYYNNVSKENRCVWFIVHKVNNCTAFNQISFIFVYTHHTVLQTMSQRHD